MPNDDLQSRIELLVGIDKSTYTKSRNLLDSLFASRRQIEIDLDVAGAAKQLKDVDSKVVEKFESELKGVADKVREAVAGSGDKIDKALASRFDTTIGSLVGRMGDLHKEIALAAGAGNQDRMEAILLEQANIAARVEEETDAHKRRIEAAKKLDKALKPDLKKFKDASEALGSGFLDAIGKAKSGDVAGLAESLFGAMSAGAGKAAEMKGMQAAAASTEAAATALGTSAATLSVAAGALALVGGAIASVITLLVAADGQAKELNKTLMEGASVADFAFGEAQDGAADVTATLGAARRAAQNLANDYRGTGEEFAGIIAQLNQAGFSYAEMGKAAGTHLGQVKAIEKVTRSTFVWSQALGISTSETAEAMATWSNEFGADLDKINTQFASIVKFAQEGGFNVKRFFTAVSQATAGMAIYNVRMEEAAALLSKTQKILGDTDASDFIKSLTQGFADEGMTERIKRVMIAGGKDTQKIFEATATRTAKSFGDTFAGSGTADKIAAAFKDSDAEFDVSILSDPAMLKKTWGDIDDKSRRLIIARLRQNGDEQSSAAARQLETLGRLTDASTGGLSDQVKGLAALDMQGKLAFKLQTLGDKRLSDMSAVELAAFEQYAGISGSQLEQLMRVESQLMAEYELAKSKDETTAKSFQEFIATNEEAAAKLDDVKKIEDQASYFARSTVENTRSVFAVLQNTIASILNDIYDLMVAWMGSDKNLSKESLDKQAAAINEIRSQRETLTKRLEAIDEELAKVDQTISTTGEDSAEHQEALQKKDKLEAEIRKKSAAREVLATQERQVVAMGEGQLGGLNDKSAVLSDAARMMAESGADIDAAAEHLSSEELLALRKERRAAGVAEVPKEWLDASGKATGAAIVSSMFELGGYNPLYEGFGASIDDARTVQGQTTLKSLVEDDGASEENLDLLYGQSETSEAALTEQRKALKADEKFQKAFPKEAEAADLAALKKYEGWKRGLEMGLTGDDLINAVDEFAASGTIRGEGVLAMASDEKQDFVMRPGQSAQRFSSSDTLVGFKPGGPIAGAMGGGGGTVNITINGGNQAEVYNTVKAALKNSGLRP